MAGTIGAKLMDRAELLLSADVTFLAVPDGQISTLAADLAGAGAAGDGLVVHLSGSLGREVLEPLRRCGFDTGALHPLQVLSGWRIPPGTTFAVDAEGHGAQLLSRLVADLGGVEIRIPEGSRTAYHAAAVMAANLGMALMAEAVDLMERAGIDREKALAGLAGLTRGGIEAAAERGLPEALTGPVVRGDVETVRRHLDLLRQDPDLLRAYQAVSLLALRQARGMGIPEEGVAAEIKRLLEADR